VDSIYDKLVFIHHKLVLSLRSESTPKISFPFNLKPSTKSLSSSVDGPEKVNCHPQRRPIKRQNQKRR